MKPIIGITPSPSDDVMPHGTFPRHAIADAYVAAVVAAGGVPIVLPPQPAHVPDLLALLDGVLLSGGADVDPGRYGAEEIHPATYGINEPRDEFEIAIVEAAVARGVPLFGICRGVQVLNVALGGTLIQDIPTRNVDDNGIAHRQHEIGLPPHAVGHVVRVDRLGIAAELFADDTIGVNSFHHQAVDRLAPGLTAVATSPDGLIEAVVAREGRWMLGVQWHPELMFAYHPQQLRPFQALVEAATARRLTPIA